MVATPTRPATESEQSAPIDRCYLAGCLTPVEQMRRRMLASCPGALAEAEREERIGDGEDEEQPFGGLFADFVGPDFGEGE